MCKSGIQMIPSLIWLKNNKNMKIKRKQDQKILLLLKRGKVKTRRWRIIKKMTSQQMKMKKEMRLYKEKRKCVPRGPTLMASLGITEVITKNPYKATVSFNNKDQPIGDPSVQLASLLGVLVRRNIQLNFKDWRVVPKEAKANVWKIFQMRFIVDDFYRDYYYGKMGCYLKEARSRKAGKILALDELEEEER